MGNLEQGGERSWDATQTLWRDAIAEGSVAEDSIRVSAHSVATLAHSKPRFRTLEPAPESSPDFLLGQELGSGGMGIVYAANQTAFNREVAVKMVKPGRKSAAGAADALMAEAVVTGHLEHPNVVPIYDLGIDAEGNLFYAMKEVQGFPWSQVMGEKTLDDNLGILQRVADTISFAHSRGVLHRDLKPHNIMLGEFGEVMVMDWGASCMVEANVPSAETSFCGTPAYMPPEMARGDLSRQGETSDVYLLGAMLYQIISGYPPRREKDPVLCLNLASENFIEPLEEHGELLRIALEAMASAPADRFSNVRKFQQAIRDYRSHSESLVLQESARLNLVRAKQERNYDLFNRSIYGFREALDLWPGNPDADRLRIEASVEYARCAFGNNDFELAQSLLDPADPGQRELLDLVAKAIRDRDAYKRRNRRLLFTARMLGLILLLIFAAAFFMIRAEQRKTHAEHRKSLANLIAAHYGEQNYEATVSSFWKLHDQYGMDSLDEETLLDVRVAAAMNPYRGSIATDVGNPLGIVSANEEGCVWVVGERVLKKVRLDSVVGYEPATLISIHDFTFGKQRTPGTVGEAIELPAPVVGSESVHEAADGTLWAGSGSSLYRREGEQWISILDVSQLDYPPLPEEYNIDRAAVEEWMASKGRKLPITGILLDKAQRHAAIALGPRTVCWIDLENMKCLGWLAAGYGTLMNHPLKGGENAGVLLMISPDERELVFRTAARNQSMIFWFSLPDMRRTAYAYNRDYPIRAVSYNRDGGFHYATHDGHLFSPDDHFMELFNTHAFYGAGVRNRWDPYIGGEWDLPLNNIVDGAFSPDGMKCGLLAEEGSLAVATGTKDEGFELVRRIVDRDYSACLVDDDGLVCLATAEGQVHLYDMRSYAICAMPVDGSVSNICRGWTPTNLIGLVEDDGEITATELGMDAEGRVGVEPLMSVVAETLACDPAGRFLAVGKGRDTRIYNLADKREVFSWRNSFWEWSPILSFDGSGTYFLQGGSWYGGLLVLENGSWKNVMTRTMEMAEVKGGSHYTDVQIDDAEDEKRLLLTRGEPKTLQAYLLTEDGGPPELKWSMNTGSSPLALIPFSDPVSGKRKYWCKLWFQDFQLYDAETGEKTEFQTHWMRKGLGHPEFRPKDPRVVFPMEDGRLQIALKSDLYPIFDPRSIDFKVDQAVLSTDASRLYLLSGGKLHCIKLPNLGK